MSHKSYAVCAVTLVAYLGLLFAPLNDAVPRSLILAYALSLPLVLAVLLTLGVTDIIARLSRRRRAEWGRSLVWSAGLLIYLLFSAAYRSVREGEVEKQEDALFPLGLSSSQTLEDVRAALGSAEAPVQVSHVRYPSGWWGPCPRYHMNTVSISNHAIHGGDGLFVVTFFNERLFQLEWRFRNLSSLLGNDEADLDVEALALEHSAYVRSWRGGAALLWEDTRIREEIRDRYWFCLPPNKMFVP